MAGLPNSHLAILDLRKLEDYCLNPLHPRGRHKARVFRDAIGVGQNEAGWLRDVLLTAARVSDATKLGRDAFGDRWRTDVLIARQNKEIVVRTIWMVRIGEQAPRFVTCWVL